MSPSIKYTLVIFSLAVVSFGQNTEVMASPWTLPQHELVLSSAFRFAQADEEYLQDGTRQVYPLDGQFQTSSLDIDVRYGLTDRVELELHAGFKHLSFEADSVILDLAPEMLSRQDARNSIIDFDVNRFGAADMNMFIRYAWIRNIVRLTPEVSLKVPLGYDKPRGTFKNVDAYLAGEDERLEVEDDVSLGDGQVDLTARLLFGAFIPQTKTFMRGSLGFSYRFGAPGNQFNTGLKVGQFLNEKVILFAGARYDKTVTEGEVIGQTFVDTQPTQNATDYKFESVAIRDLRLDKDFLLLELGVILSLSKGEIQFSYEQVLTGRNVAKLHSMGLGYVLSFADVTAEPDAEREQAPPSEEKKDVVVPEKQPSKPLVTPITKPKVETSPTIQTPTQPEEPLDD